MLCIFLPLAHRIGAANEMNCTRIRCSASDIYIYIYTIYIYVNNLILVLDYPF